MIRIASILLRLSLFRSVFVIRLETWERLFGRTA